MVADVQRRDTVVLKLGGELIEAPDALVRVAAAIARTAARHPCVVVHGGGREIDAELARVGITKRAIDGLRITDEATLEVVLGVLAGRVNTRLVAAVAAAGAAAIGLTGADGQIGLAELAPPYRALDGHDVQLGLVGRPVSAPPPRLVCELTGAGYTPIVASLGITREGQLLNVNADALAAQLSGNLGAARLVVAGTTPGVIDDTGGPIARLDDRGVERLIASGRVSAGMIAKLDACRAARRSGVPDVRIVDGRDTPDFDAARGTAIETAA